MTVLLFTISFALATPQARAVQTADKLQGVWTVTAGELDGQPTEVIKGDTLTIQGNAFSIKGKEGESKGTLKLGADKKPLSADFAYTDGPSKGKTLLAIYEVNGDDCKFCFAPPDAKERPTELMAKAGSKNFLVTLKREKK